MAFQCSHYQKCPCVRESTQYKSVHPLEIFSENVDVFDFFLFCFVYGIGFVSFLTQRKTINVTHKFLNIFSKEARFFEARNIASDSVLKTDERGMSKETII